MAADRSPVPRAASALQWLSGLLVLGVLLGGLVAAAITLWESVDLRELTGGAGAKPAPLPPPALVPTAAAWSTAGFRAGLYVSAASARYFPDSTFYPGLIRDWEERIRRAGGTVTRVHDADGVRALGPGALLVAPAALCLSRRELSALEAHATAGGGLLATWAVGARDGACRWRGWDGVSEIAGSPDVRQLERREALYLTVPSGTPLSMGLAPATRIELRSESQLAVALQGVHVYWSDWSLNPAPAASGGAADGAAVARDAPGGGRIVWLGFLPSQAARGSDSLGVSRLADAGLRWAAGVAGARLAPWPGGRRSALLLTEDVESGFENANALAKLARDRSVPASFYVVSQLALDHPEMGPGLDSVGEVGSQTSDHRPVAGLPETEQRLRLRRSWSEVRGWIGHGPVGLRPPEESFDTTTLRIWRGLGGRYLLAVNNARTASPELYDTPEGRVALLPRVMKDDYNVMVQEDGSGPEALRRAYLDGLRKISAVGGLAVLSLHSQIATAPRVAAVGEVLDSLAPHRSEWWIATGRAIADWWISRSEATLSVDAAADGALSLHVTAPPGDSLAGAWVELQLPGGAGGSWTPAVDGRPIPFRPTPDGMEMPVGGLAPGESRTIRVGRG